MSPKYIIFPLNSNFFKINISNKISINNSLYFVSYKSI